jgi:hypothetical protein
MSSSAIRRIDRAATAVAIVVALAAAPRRARAEVTAADAAVARGLFQEARKLMSEKRWAEACPKLEASERIDPGKGTEFNLADCYEHTGRPASAWTLFEQVVAEAHSSNQGAHEALARARVEAISARVPRLLVEVPDSNRAAGLEITCDGRPLPPAMWSTPLPFDPGAHTIAARAPGRLPWEAKTELAEGQTITVTVAPLPAPEEPAVVPPIALVPPIVGAEPPPRPMPSPDHALVVEPKADDSAPTRRVVGLGVAGVGLAGLVTAGVFGVLSISSHDAAKQWCNSTTNACVSQQGVDDRTAALGQGNASSILFVAGGVLLATGAVLWFTASSPKPTTHVGVGALGAGLFGLVAAGEL